ncbi:hypothetical protein J5500_01475, partial [Candidatus Saccharibacteria bacterium]|nr:hypothetical protein [Candidatus Saccharibacteria bacterium]
MNNKIKLIILSLSLATLWCLVNSFPTYAYPTFSPHNKAGCIKGIKHNDGGDPNNNDAIKDVCSSSACPAGAMWINGAPAGKYDVSEVITKTVSESANTVDAYLQGALVYNSSSTYSPYNNHSITTYGLSICRHGTKGCDKSILKKGNLVGYVTNKKLGYLDRGYMGNTGYRWTDHWAAKKVKLTINVAEFKKVATHKAVTVSGKSCDQYSDKISIVRQPSTSSTGSTPGAGANTALDTSDIKLVICPDDVTTYTGTTTIYDGSSAKENNYTINNIAANSKKIKFVHNIKRNNDGSTSNDNERYFVNSWGTGYNLGDKDHPSNKDFAINTNEDVHKKEIDVALSPGETKTIWQTLHYESDSSKTTIDATPKITCKLMKDDSGKDIGGRACAQLSRAEAKFTGSIGVKIKADGSNFVDPTASTVDANGTRITTTDGSYTVRFTNSISRKASTGTDKDEAGGTASARWYSTIRTGSTSGTEQKRSPATAGADSGTTALSNGGTDNIITTASNFSYTGTLKPGESRTVCNVLDYTSVVNKKKGNTWASPAPSKCVTVYRPKVNCQNFTGKEYGVRDGENLGRIGVKNSSYAASSSYAYTSSDPESFTSSNSYTVTKTIWARPGDSIRFSHQACAGGDYAVHNTSSLDNTTYKSVYTASGSLSGSSSTGYLFGASIPTVSQSSPLKYSNSRSWNSTDSGSGFLTGDIVEHSDESPSDTNTSTYNRDTYNKSSYSCVNLKSGASFVLNHYQIAGQATASDTGCHAYSKTAVASDVGHTITQSLSWNHLVVTNGSANSNYTNNPKFTAKALVRIPYNYNLQPTISSNADSKVVYLGSTNTFDTNVYVEPRANSSFGNDKADNTYATVTKKTTVTAGYYYIIDGHSTDRVEKVASANRNGEDKRIRLNTLGSRSGTGGNGDAISEGGAKYASFNVYVNDSLNVGDKVCAYIKVSPADSHNDYMSVNPVSGAGTDSAALSESGTGSTERTSCYTVAKKPTMSVEASNTFSGGANGFVTSRYTKRFTAGGTDYLFGSWSEYGVYGNVKTAGSRGIASGAT